MLVLKVPATGYSFNLADQTWDKSRSICEKRGGDLISIETEEEWDFIKNEIHNNTKGGWHIGLVRENGSWTWVSGRPLTICKWGDQQSGGRNRAMLVKEKLQGHFVTQVLNDGQTLLYICEMLKGKTTLHLYNRL